MSFYNHFNQVVHKVTHGVQDFVEAVRSKFDTSRLVRGTRMLAAGVALLVVGTNMKAANPDSTGTGVAKMGIAANMTKVADGNETKVIVTKTGYSLTGMTADGSKVTESDSVDVEALVKAGKGYFEVVKDGKTIIIPVDSSSMTVDTDKKGITSVKFYVDNNGTQVGISSFNAIDGVSKIIGKESLTVTLTADECAEQVVECEETVADLRSAVVLDSAVMAEVFTDIQAECDTAAQQVNIDAVKAASTGLQVEITTDSTTLEASKGAVGIVKQDREDFKLAEKKFFSALNHFFSDSVGIAKAQNDLDSLEDKFENLFISYQSIEDSSVTEKIKHQLWDYKKYFDIELDSIDSDSAKKIVQSMKELDINGVATTIEKHFEYLVLEEESSLKKKEALAAEYIDLVKYLEIDKAESIQFNVLRAGLVTTSDSTAISASLDSMATQSQTLYNAFVLSDSNLTKARDSLANAELDSLMSDSVKLALREVFNDMAAQRDTALAAFRVFAQEAKKDMKEAKTAFYADIEKAKADVLKQQKEMEKVQKGYTVVKQVLFSRIVNGSDPATVTFNEGDWIAEQYKDLKVIGALPDSMNMYTYIGAVYNENQDPAIDSVSGKATKGVVKSNGDFVAGAQYVIPLNLNISDSMEVTYTNAGKNVVAEGKKIQDAKDLVKPQTQNQPAVEDTVVAPAIEPTKEVDVNPNEVLIKGLHNDIMRAIDKLHGGAKRRMNKQYGAFQNDWAAKKSQFPTQYINEMGKFKDKVVKKEKHAK